MKHSTGSLAGERTAAFAASDAADRVRMIQDRRSSMLEHWAASWDDARGCFPERQDADFRPTDESRPNRSLTQFRLLWSLCSAGADAPAPYRVLADRIVERTVDRYWDAQHGGWLSAIAPSGAVADDAKSLYTHAFAVLSLARYHAVTGESAAAQLALRTLEVVAERLACAGGGFFGAASRDWATVAAGHEQNPHMHLFEACLEAADAGLGPQAAGWCSSLLQLALDRFVTSDGGLVEFFDDRWNPHSEAGHLREPGHHFEWVWLLAEQQRVFGVDPHLSALQRALIATGARGWDPIEGGVFDCVDPAGSPIRITKRLWPLAECVRALTLEPAADRSALLAASSSMLMDHALRPDGSWIEWMHRDLTPQVDYMPGTSVYHLLGTLHSLEAASA